VLSLAPTTANRGSSCSGALRAYEQLPPTSGGLGPLTMHEIVNRGELKWDAQPCSGRAPPEVIMPELVNRGELKWDAQPCSGRAPPEVSSYLMVHTCTGCGNERGDCEIDASGNWCFECRDWMCSDPPQCFGGVCGKTTCRICAIFPGRTIA